MILMICIEVERAIENLVKSGKMYAPNGRQPVPAIGGPRQYPDFGTQGSQDGKDGKYSQQADPRARHSMGDYEHPRPHSGGHMQSFYAQQRYGGRPSEAEQMMQAKRRMAAQRERELRNYHQEQQYNRSELGLDARVMDKTLMTAGVLSDVSGAGTTAKSDRSMSPSTLSEEGRRELIARQHRALYGNEAPNFYQPNAFDDNTSRPDAPGSGVQGPAGVGRGPSPRAMDPFGMGQSQSSLNADTAAASGIPTNQGERTSSNSPPASANNAAAASFTAFEGAPQQNTSNSPPRAESPARQAQKAATAPIGSGMGPIGSRPQQQAPAQMLNKRSTTPLASPMTFGFGSGEQNNATERSGSAASNPSGNAEKSNVSMAWGSGSAVWGSKNPLGTTSVWG